MDEPEWKSYLHQFDILTAADFQDIPNKNETNKFCVLMEFRSNPLLISVIKNFMYLLKNKGWGLIVYHGLTNEDFLKNGLYGWKNVYFIRTMKDNIKPEFYSDILCEIPFWNTLSQFGCEHSLIFQIDTVLLKDTIDEFLEYDYVGSPWCGKWLGVAEVGNGGLSIRKISTMKYIIENYPRSTHTKFGYQTLQNEDIFFSYWLHIESEKNPNIKMPSVEVAQRFSVETIFNEDTCGMHQPHLSKFPNRDAFVKLLEKRFFETDIKSV